MKIRLSLRRTFL